MTTADTYDFCCRVKFNVGASALEHLPSELDALNARMPLVMAARPRDAHLVVKAFRDSGLTLVVADRVDETASGETLHELARQYRLHRCDAIVAVGCGALADAAKALNLMVSTGVRELATLVGPGQIVGPLRPLVLVPTVGGNALESAAVASFGDWHLASTFLMPDLLVIDPRQTRQWSPQALIAMGLSALALSTETLLAERANGIALSYAQAAVRMIAAHLLETLRGKGAKHGPLALVNAAALAGCLVNSRAPGINQVLATALAPFCRLSPGAVAGLLLPYSLAFLCLKRQQCPEALLLPLAGAEIFATADRSLRPHVAINALHALLHDLHKASRGVLPRSLAEAGVPQPELAQCARQAAASRPDLLQEREALLVLEHAWEARPIVMV